MGMILALLICSVPIQTVIPFEGTATSEHPDTALASRALSDAMGRALNYLSSQTGTIFTDRERKYLLHRASDFVVRRKVTSSGFNGAAYVFSAEFSLDLSGVVRALTSFRHAVSRPRVKVWTSGLSRSQIGDLERLFPSQLYDVRFFHSRGRFPHRCPRRVTCISVSLKKDSERVIVTYLLRRRRRKDIKVQVAALNPSMALAALPDSIRSVLSPPSFSDVQVQVKGLSDGFRVLRFLEVLKKQKGPLFALSSYTMDGSSVVMSLRLAGNTSLQAVLEGLFLGDGIKTVLTRNSAGRWILSVVFPPEPREEEDNEFQER